MRNLARKIWDLQETLRCK